MSTVSTVPGTERELVTEGDDPQREVQPFTQWTTLSEFSVRLHKQSNVNADIYANGRQQAPIEVHLQARDRNNVAVSLTQTQLESSIRLIEYESNRAVVGCTHDKDDRYVYEWPLVRDDAVIAKEEARGSETPEAAAQTITIYVRKTNQTTTWIAAEITSPSGTKFRTNTPNPTVGKFDSWIKLRGREPTSFKWDCFTMTWENAYNPTYWDVDLYYIRFKDSNLRIVASRHYGWSGHDKWHYAWMKSGNQVQHVCYGADYPRDVRHYSMAGSNYLTISINRRPGQATAARIKDARDYGNVRYESCVMGYMDQHGNESFVWVRGTSDGNMLYLDDPGRAGEEPPPVDEDLPPGDVVSE